MPNELNMDYFRVKHEQILPQKGRVLLAEPSLVDEYFKRSVVLLVEHDEKNTVGFVLNKMLEFRIAELMPDFPDFDAKISIGGPVSPNTIHFIHTVGDLIPDATKVGEGLYWGGDFDALKDLVAAKGITKNQIRFFVGYAGWSENQLAQEIEEESWLVTELDTVQIIGGNDDLWKRTVEQLGSKYKPWMLYPENPSLN